MNARENRAMALLAALLLVLSACAPTPADLPTPTQEVSPGEQARFRIHLSAPVGAGRQDVVVAWSGTLLHQPGSSATLDVEMRNLDTSQVKPVRLCLSLVDDQGILADLAQTLVQVAPESTQDETLTVRFPADLSPGIYPLALVAQQPGSVDAAAVQIALGLGLQDAGQIPGPALAKAIGACPPVAVTAEGPTPTPAEAARVDLAELGVSFRVPADWQPIKGQTAWSPPGEAQTYLGFQSELLTPPAEVEAVLVPSPLAPSQQAVVQESEPVELAQGSGRRYTVAVMAPNGAGEALGLETHLILVRTVEGGGRRAYDLYAGAPNGVALERAEAILNQVADSLELSETTPAGQATPDTKIVTVYFSNSALNPQVECDLVFPVEREVPLGADPVTAALNQLFEGPTPEEEAEGYASFFSDATADALLGFKTEGTTAYVNLRDIQQEIPNAGTSCGSAQFLASMNSTVEAALPQVERVLYAFDGDPAAFYAFVQMGCGDFNDNCDPAPFGGLQ